MLTLLDPREPGVLGFRVSRRLSHDDHERMIPLLLDQIERSGGVRAVVDLRELEGVEPRAILDEVRFDVRHARDVERCAVVGDERWQRTVTEWARPIFGADRIRFFGPDELDAAWRFAAGGRDDAGARDEREGRGPVLVATDFSTEARSAYAPAAELARRLEADLHLVHVVVPVAAAAVSPALGVPATPTGVDEERLIEELRRTMDGEVSRSVAALADVVVTGEIATGTSPSAALADRADSLDAPLIALASTAGGGLSRLLQRSVAASLQRRTDRPVVVFSADRESTLPERPHVGIAIDLPEDEADPDVTPILAFARRLGAHVTLIHVLRPPESAPHRRDRVEDRLTRLVRRLPGGPVGTAVVAGDSVEEALREESARRGVDLLCVASHGRSGLSRLLSGSTSETVFRGSDLPITVFTLRPAPAANGTDADAEGDAVLRPAAVERMSTLIRGEISAIETYVQALDKVDEPTAADTLEVLKRNHIDATNTLRREVHALSADPPTDSGAWGTFVKAIEGTATLLGDGAALRALREGEELGVRLYEKALEDDRLPGASRRLLREKLLPRHKTHVETIRQHARAL
ncbi:MAG: universal stress protein [Planctomycetota bacterium JB042]